MSIITSSLIYDIQSKIEDMLKPVAAIEKIEAATLAVKKVFFIKKNHIAGCQVLTGKIEVGQKCSLFRKDVEIMRGKVKSLQVEKNIVESAGKNSECGAVINIDWQSNEFKDFEVSDKIVTYK